MSSIVYDGNINPHFRNLTAVVRPKVESKPMDKFTSEFLKRVIQVNEDAGFSAISTDIIADGMQKVNDIIKNVSDTYCLDVPVVLDEVPVDKQRDFEFFSTSERKTPIVAQQKNKRDFIELIDFFERDKVLLRLQQRKFIAACDGVDVTFADPAKLSYSSIDDSLCSRPKEYLGETPNGELRKKAMDKFLSSANPTIIVTVLADGGGGVKTYCNNNVGVKRLIVVNFSDYYLGDDVLRRYKLVLHKTRPDVIVPDPINFDFSIHECADRLSIIRDKFVENGIDFSVSSFVYNFLPVLSCVAPMFASSYCAYLCKDIAKDYKRFSFPEICMDYAQDSAMLSLLFSTFKDDHSITSVDKYYDESRGEVVQFVHHSYFRELVGDGLGINGVDYCVNSRITDYVGKGNYKSNYSVMITYDSSPLVYSYAIAEPVSFIEVSDFVEVSDCLDSDVKVGFVSLAYKFVEVDEKVLSMFKYYSGDDARVILPRKTKYYGVIDDVGKFHFIDYVDKHHNYLTRRMMLQRLLLPVVPLYYDCCEDRMLLVFPDSNMVNSSFVVTRDVYYGLVDLRIEGDFNKTCLFGVCSLCYYHGYVRDKAGLMCLLDVDVSILPSTLRSVRSAYNLDIGADYCSIPEIFGLMITRVKCLGNCVSIDISSYNFHRDKESILAYGYVD
jgi:hypothetical protein